MIRWPQGLPEDRLGNRALLKIVGVLLAAFLGFALLHRLVAWGLAGLHAALDIGVAPSMESSFIVAMIMAMLVVGPLFDRRGLWRRRLAFLALGGMAATALLADLVGAFLIGWIGPAVGGVLEAVLWLAPLFLLLGVGLLVVFKTAARPEPDADTPE